MRWDLNFLEFLRISNGYTSQNGPKVPHKKTEHWGNFPVSHKTWPNEGGSSDRPFGGAKNNYPVSHYGEPGMMYFRILNEELPGKPPHLTDFPMAIVAFASEIRRWTRLCIKPKKSGLRITSCTSCHLYAA